VKRSFRYRYPYSAYDLRGDCHFVKERIKGFWKKHLNNKAKKIINQMYPIDESEQCF